MTIIVIKLHFALVISGYFYSGKLLNAQSLADYFNELIYSSQII